MTVIELKAQLHTLIEQEDSVAKLEAVQALLNEEDTTEPTWDQEALQRRIIQGDREIAAGKAIPWEEAKARMEAYLDEK